MRTHGRSVVVAVVMISVTLLSAAESSARVMTLRLRDGSRLTALVESPRIRLETAYGAVEVPAALVQSAQRTGDGSEMQVAMTNGDRFSGRVTTAALQVRHALGSLCAPWKDVAELCVSAGRDDPAQVVRRPAAPNPVRVEAYLHDGSCILGNPKGEHVRFFSALGKRLLPWALVRDVVLHDDRETCTVRFWSGDVIVGCIDWDSCEIATGLGPAHVSAVTAARIEVSLGGTDLVGMPRASVSGTRYFMGAVNNSQPKRIGGRVRPASQFIEAHASGRIEYVFDAPVTEFRAIATMYESYCAHKGRVVFRVETEHGVVYATRSLRNLEREEIYAQFPPARKIILITDQQGSADEDWSVWLWPEVR